MLKGNGKKCRVAFTSREHGTATQNAVYFISDSRKMRRC